MFNKHQYVSLTLRPRTGPLSPGVRAAGRTGARHTDPTSGIRRRRLSCFSASGLLLTLRKTFSGSASRKRNWCLWRKLQLRGGSKCLSCTLVEPSCAVSVWYLKRTDPQLLTVIISSLTYPLWVFRHSFPSFSLLLPGITSQINHPYQAVPRTALCVHGGGGSN